MKKYDIAIVGAGPAGLAAAQKINGSGYRAILIDRGCAITDRDKDSEEELTQGHGGAGLYSDGKFSFYPSASALWKLPKHDALREAYDWTCKLLCSYGLDTPPFPTDVNAYTFGSGEWVLKEYPSDYLSLSARIEIVNELVKTIDAEIISNTKVTSYQYFPHEDIFNFSIQNENGTKESFQVRKIIIASGRFYPLAMESATRKVFHRFEVGFRIEQPESLAFFGDMAQLDPKLKFQSNTKDVEWRTFCACRNGKTVFTRTHDLWTVSGHSDGPPTGCSNVGFNTRILSEEIAQQVIEIILKSLSKKESYFSISLQKLLSGEYEAAHTFDTVYGTKLKSIMLDGLNRLIDKFPVINHEQTRLIGPTLEGVGWYPELNRDLRFPYEPVWVIGDACGLFRGIIAAFISGHYTAKLILDELDKSGYRH